jgi:hypothetical protein
LAEPAAAVPPSSVATTCHQDGSPRAASIMAGNVVTSSSSMIRGLVSATYARTAAHPEPPGDGGWGTRWSPATVACVIQGTFAQEYRHITVDVGG